MATRPAFPRTDSHWARSPGLVWALAVALLLELLVVVLLAAPPAGAATRLDDDGPRRLGNSQQFRTASNYYQLCRQAKRKRHAKADRAEAGAKRVEKRLQKRRGLADEAQADAKRATRKAVKAEKAIADAVGPRSLKKRERAADKAARKARKLDRSAAKASRKVRESKANARELRALEATFRKRAKRTRCPKPVFNPIDFTVFNYPSSPKVRRKAAIRFSVLSAIKQAPSGSRIRIAAFTFVDRRIAKALVAADRRGVSVQVLVNRRLISKSAPFTMVRKGLGGYRDKRRKGEPVSWARTCRASCLGNGGQLHSKMYLFSRVGQTKWVSMVSSANLTMFAVANQWNSLDTITGRKSFREFAGLFRKMTPDRPKKLPKTFRTPKVKAYVFPQRIKMTSDPMRRVIENIRCTAPSGYGKAAWKTKATVKKAAKKAGKKKRVVREKVRTRRTVIRISMYTWFHRRGLSLARMLREKWEAGCNIKIVVGGMARSVFRTLRSPEGRGRIPVRQLVRRNAYGNVTAYDHHKYVLINGGYDGSGQRMTWTGSMNLSERGFRNDELLLRFTSKRVHRDYAGNFKRIWRSPHARRAVEGRLDINLPE